MNEVFQEIQAHFRVTSEPDYRDGLRKLLQAVEAWTENPNTTNTYGVSSVAKSIRKEVGNDL